MLFHQDNAQIHMSSAPMAKFCYELLPHPVYSQDLASATISCFQTWRNSSKERDSLPENSSSPTQRLILKDWTNYSDGWKNWRIVESNVSSWKETMLRNKNESIKNVLLCFSKNLLTCPRMWRRTVMEKNKRISHL